MGEDRAPDEIVDRDVDEVGEDSGVIAQSERKNIDETDAREFQIRTQHRDEAAAGRSEGCGRGAHREPRTVAPASVFPNASPA